MLGAHNLSKGARRCWCLGLLARCCTCNGGSYSRTSSASSHNALSAQWQRVQTLKAGPNTRKMCLVKHTAKVLRVQQNWLPLVSLPPTHVNVSLQNLSLSADAICVGRLYRSFVCLGWVLVLTCVTQGAGVRATMEKSTKQFVISQVNIASAAPTVNLSDVQVPPRPGDQSLSGCNAASSTGWSSSVALAYLFTVSSGICVMF